MIGPRIVLHGFHRGLVALRAAVVAEVEDLNRLIYHILRAGVVASIGLVAFAFLLSAGGSGPIPATTLPLRDLGAEVLRLSPAAFVSLGILVLILTPVARVAGSLLSFVEEGERRYVVVTAVVLGNLLLSLGLLLG